MRHAFVLSLLFAIGCDDGPNRQEFANLSRQALLDHDRITELATGAKPGTGTLAADVAEMKQLVAAQAQTITKLQADLAAAQAKLAAGGALHRMGPDGEDLGIGAPGSTWVWRPEGEVNLAALFTVYYKQADCAGQGYIANGLRQGQLALLVNGDVASVDITSFTPGGEWVSQLDADERKCIPAGDPRVQSGGLSKWKTVGHMPLVTLGDTHLEIR